MEKNDQARVARLAGVSTATVSRVFNSPHRVKSDKRQRVLTAAKTLGYTPNKFASALARSATGRILFLDCNKLVTHDKNHGDFYTGLYKSSLEGVLRVIETSPYHLTIDLEGKLHTGDYDGVILYDVDNQNDILPLMNREIPLVYGHHLGGIETGIGVGVDNYSGSRIAAGYLKNRGHSRLGYITGQVPELNSHGERLRGFQDELDLPDTNLRIIETEISPQGGARAAREIIPLIKIGEITALGVVNDLTAFGLVQELLGQGIQIPDEVEIIGFDNLPILRLLPQGIPTIDLGLKEVYNRAAEQLLELLGSSQSKNPHITTNRKTLIPPRLIIPEYR